MSPDEPPEIEHDPNEFLRPIILAIWTMRIQLFVLVGIGFAIKTYFGVRGAYDLWNVPFVILFLLLLAWCISPRIPSVDGDGHESARKSFAFRLGKKLNRILHHFH